MESLKRHVAKVTDNRLAFVTTVMNLLAPLKDGETLD
jgi:hypothetical protein